MVAYTAVVQESMLLLTCFADLHAGLENVLKMMAQPSGVVQKQRTPPVEVVVE